MAGRRPKMGMSYGELADYEDAVEEVRLAAVAIAKETRYYEKENGMLVSDGQVFTSHIRPEIARMQKAMRKIDAMAKKYGGL